jgi:hypothetical protein
VTRADPQVWVRARWGDLSLEGGGQKIFDSGALWQLYAEGGSYRFRFTSSPLGPVPYKIARFDHDFTSGEVYFHHPYFPSAQPLYPLEYPLDELLFMNILARGKGVEVHAGGIIDPSGNGHLFIGQSRAGKTTMARLWHEEPGITVLSDDRIILRQGGASLWMYGTPWHGEAEMACSARAPLKRVYFLQHGPKNERVATGEAEPVARLFASSFLPFYHPEALGFTLSFLEEIVKTVPCCGLRFLPDESAVEFILSLSPGEI